LLGLARCTSITSQAQRTKPSPEPSLFTVEGVGLSEEIRADVGDAAQHARTDLAVWGDLRQPVLIVVHQSHADLEAAVGLHDLHWLRAWAQYDQIDLQSPDTFGHRDYRGPLRELLSHELTHVLMYQHIGDQETWSGVWIPFWFREGMASWTSRQGYRRGTLATLGRRLLDHPPATDPLLDGRQLTRTDQPLAYGAAHWAFDRLVVEAGEEAVLAIMDELRRSNACFTKRAPTPVVEDQLGLTPETGAPLSEASQLAPNSDHAIPASAPHPVVAGEDCSERGALFGAAFQLHVGMSEVEFATQYRDALIAAAETG
jgi:hypothetical protein